MHVVVIRPQALEYISDEVVMSAAAGIVLAESGSF